MDNSTKKLMSGSMIYFVGNALTQMISLLLMRFVTGNITPEEYGFYNLIITITNLVVPFATLQIADAVFKFVLKAQSENEKKVYFTICFVVSAASTLLIIGAVYGLSAFFQIPSRLYVALYIVTNALYNIYQKIARSLNKNTIFVTGNLIKTLFFLLLEILLISIWNLGVEALFLANILSLAFFLVYVELRIHAFRFFDLRVFKRSAFKEMMRFSLPLIPNAGFWWLTSSVNNVIISSRMGVGVNGIYSVSSKFSGALSMVTSVLNMSWQDTAIADYGNRNFDVFLTKTFNSFVKLIFSAISVVIPLVALLLPYMVDPSYYDAIPYTPFLLLTAGTSAMSGFMAQIFTGKGETRSILTTSIFGMIANILLILLLVGKIGLWAAVIGSVLADAVMFISRLIMARKEFAKGIDYASFALIFVMIAASIYIYLCTNSTINLIWFFASALLALILNRQFILDMLAVLFKYKRGDTA